MAKQDESLHYFANVGVNTYVSVQLSFLNKSERRCTHAVARTFCPEFDHHMEVSCDLLQPSSSGETRSLAEELQEASAVFTLWSKDSHTGSVIFLLFLPLSSPKCLVYDIYESILYMFFANRRKVHL